MHVQGGVTHAVHGLIRGVLTLMHSTTFAAFNTVLKYLRRTHNTLLALCPIEVRHA